MLRAMTARRRELSEREGGFSLVELIVAMFVIAIVLVFLIGAQISSMVTVSDARKREQATAFANEAMEQLRAIPWAVLANGLDTNYASAGTDPNVQSGKLEVDGQSRAIRTSTHDFTNADVDLRDDLWTPIFIDTSGSNTQERTDPSLAGATFTVRAYVLEPSIADSSIVTLAVVVNWTDSDGDNTTTMWSEAFRGDACNSAQESVQPYLTGCEAYFSSESSSGTFSTSVQASIIDAATGSATRTNLLYPSSNAFYSFFVKSATTSSILESQQVTNTTAYVQYGSTAIDDNDDSTEIGDNGWLNGGDSFELSASNDIVSSTSSNPTDVSATGGTESARTLSSSSALATLWAYSDRGRTGTIDASMTTPCVTGIPADSGCSLADLGNEGSLANGSTYMLMDVAGTTFRLARRLSESTSNSDEAWTARFPTSAATTTDVGCTTVTDSGCVSAGASRSSATLSIAKIISGSWDTLDDDGNVVSTASSPSDGLVKVTGYTESVLAQRGVSQSDTDPVATRSGTVSWWTGAGGYDSFSISASTSRSETTETVQWTSGAYVVTAVAGVSVSAANIDEQGSDPDCEDEACTATVDGGSISVVVTYTIEHGSTEYSLTTTTVLGGMRASATYLESSDA